MSPRFTDAEPERVARLVARLSLKVEAGLHTLDSLRPFLATRTYPEQADAMASRDTAGAAVRHADLAGTSFRRLSDDRAREVVTDRQKAGRCGRS